IFDAFNQNAKIMLKGILPLQGAVQHYDWGGHDFIPHLIGVNNASHLPFAELWMGAHASAPALVEEGDTKLALDRLIAQSPQLMLGEKVIAHFGKQLPFLFKVLDVRKMLSIQAHPTKKQAEEGFRRENKAGIALTAPHRTYKDANHKPEVMVALTEFWLLHGFKSLAAIEQTLESVPEFITLQPWFATQNITTLYQYLMEMPQNEVDAILQPLKIRLEQAPPPPKNSADYWALQAFREYARPDGSCDRGIFSIYLFNLVRLQAGEGIYQGAGIPHAYLEGVNMELMANSDNVFRGGLTSKHIDVPELLKSLIFEPIEPQIITGESLSASETVYFTPAPDFELSRIYVDSQTTHENEHVYAPDIFIVISGKAIVNQTFTFEKGSIFYVVPGTNYTISAQESTVLYRATVP
ncbi:MAG: mannose-6-phosphate isomerase, class I, partial [Saprospiraceae bacterium]